MKKLRGYFAADFFHIFTYEGCAKYADRIRKETGIELYLPQENMSINDKSQEVTNKQITKVDEDELDKADILIAYIDGESIDDGVAYEIGYWSGYEKAMFKLQGDSYEPRPIIGIFSDMRRDGKGDGKLYKNQMVLGGIEFLGIIVSNFDEAIEAIKKYQRGELLEG